MIINKKQWQQQYKAINLNNDKFSTARKKYIKSGFKSGYESTLAFLQKIYVCYGNLCNILYPDLKQILEYSTTECVTDLE